MESETAFNPGPFPLYTEHEPACPVYQVCEKLEGVTIRYYDTTPFSPSGRYLALTQFPYEDQLPQPGDEARILILDLNSGKHREVATSKAWDTQLGAHLLWGKNDHELFYNEVDTSDWQCHAIRIDPMSGATQCLSTSISSLSPDADFAASVCLKRTANSQAGYGLAVPPEARPVNTGVSEDDGLTLMDTASGQSQLVLSIRELYEQLDPSSRKLITGLPLYLVSAKWSPSSQRLLLILRARRENGGWIPMIFRYELDDKSVHLWLKPEAWLQGGNHPSWCPDGESLIMNLNHTGEGLRFVRIGLDGTIEQLSTLEATRGHPSLHPGGEHIMTDAYPSESCAFGDGSSAIWSIDLNTHERRQIVRVDSTPSFTGEGNVFRLDLHPCWDARCQYFAFNAHHSGSRRVFVADCRDLFPEPSHS